MQHYVVVSSEMQYSIFFFKIVHIIRWKKIASMCLQILRIIPIYPFSNKTLTSYLLYLCVFFIISSIGTNDFSQPTLCYPLLSKKFEVTTNFIPPILLYLYVQIRHHRNEEPQAFADRQIIYERNTDIKPHSRHSTRSHHQISFAGILQHVYAKVKQNSGAFCLWVNLWNLI